jgi:chromosome segregation ATPase
MVTQITTMQKIPIGSETTHNVEHQTEVQVAHSNDLILLVSTLAVQLHQTQEELEESHELLNLMREKLMLLEPIEALLNQTVTELERSRSTSEQLRAEKEWVELKYKALRETAQQLQKELKLAQNQPNQAQNVSMK